jgi:hypothetical protein
MLITDLKIPVKTTLISGSIRNKVLVLIENFIRKNNKNPNELWVGYKEKQELEQYITNSILTNSQLKFAGLKVRFEEIDSMFCVKFNPHY